MCRALAYLGEPVRLSGLLHDPDSALISQTIDPRLLNMLNLGGFGMAAWLPDAPEPREPLTYRSTTLPIYDANLKSLADHLRPICVLAHVRGIPYRPDAGFGPQNLHPFRYAGFRWALAHNGDLAGFDRLRPGLLRHIRPDIAARIRGTTDSEWVYALMMSQLSDPAADLPLGEVTAALARTVRILSDLRAEQGIGESSSANLFLTDGRRLLVLRFTFDYGCYALAGPPELADPGRPYLSLWYTAGDRYDRSDGEWGMVGGGDSARSVLVASEPLTRDTSGWVEVPEYSALAVDQGPDGCRIRVVDVAP